jgi:hypothetical protein
VRRSPIRWLIDSLLACAVAAGSPSTATLLAQTSPAPPQAAPRASPQSAPAEIIRHTRNVPGDSKPVVVTADEIAAWQDGGETYVFLRGRVLLQQSVVQLRFDYGVARFNSERYRRTGIWHLDVYAEGNVQLDTSLELKQGPKGIIELNTRGEVKLNSQRGKVARRAMQDDPVVVRGLAAWPTAAPIVQRPAPTLPPLRRTSVEEPLVPPAPFLPGAMVPPPGGPPSGPIVPPPAAMPVPVAPPDPAAPPKSQPGPRGAAAPALPGTVIRVACYQPGEGPPGGAAVSPVPLAPPGGAAASPVPLAPPSQVAPRPPQPTPPPGPRPRDISIVPRSGTKYNLQSKDLGNGEQESIVGGGIILQVRDIPGIGLLDMEADQLVIWSRGGNPQQLFTSSVQTGDGTGATYEFYLKGNVEIRRKNIRDTQTLRADEVYYDVNRKVAIALSATLEMRINPLPGKAPLTTDPIIIQTDELQQTSETQFHVLRSDIFSSKLPSDPGLKVHMNVADLDEVIVPRRSIIGQQVYNRTTGELEEDRDTMLHGQNVFFELENVPFFYLPALTTNANDPLGPVKSISFGYNTIYGFDLGASLDMYQLLGIQPYLNTKWRLDLDYLTYRGPAVGTEFNYSGKDWFGIANRYEGTIKANAMYDRGFDVLGGPRPENDFDPDNFRGRLQWRQSIYDLPEGFSVQSQVAAISDRNYLEAYFKSEWDTDINQETFVYLKQQRDYWAYNVLIESNDRNWVTETQSLPRVDGYLLGVSPFDVLTSNTRVDVGYFMLHKTSDQEAPVSSTDQADNTGRADIWEELSYPFALGPVKVVPYVQGALTGYTDDLDGDALGRAWGGIGLRASMPLTAIYKDVQSDLFNLEGINHKIVLSANYFNASENESYTKLPQLDRLNDDASDQALRDIRPLEPQLNPANGLALQFSPIFDPQLYAIRQLVDNRIDTRDTIEVLQLDIRQRLQTKRGYPGAEHIVDWMILDLSASYFPAATRDDFGSSFAFLQYDYIWNIGDRTSFVSTGWLDPETDGPRVFTLGMYFNRPDRTNFYLGYREIEPVQSKALTGAVTYVFSPKYALTASSTYDFGTNQSLANSLIVTRIGTDLSVSFGISYNALTQSVGAVFEIVPNLLPANAVGGGNAGSLLK